MTRSDFYDRCRRHDWHHANSDDFRAWQRGQREEDRLRTAAILDEAGLMPIFAAFVAHANGRGPFPPPPRDADAVATFPGEGPRVRPGQLSLFDGPTTTGRRVLFGEAA